MYLVGLSTHFNKLRHENKTSCHTIVINTKYKWTLIRSVYIMVFTTYLPFCTFMHCRGSSVRNDRRASSWYIIYIYTVVFGGEWLGSQLLHEAECCRNTLSQLVRKFLILMKRKVSLLWPQSWAKYIQYSRSPLPNSWANYTQQAVSVTIHDVEGAQGGN